MNRIASDPNRPDPLLFSNLKIRLVYVFKNWKLLFKNFCRNTCGWKSVWKYVKCCLKTENCCLKTLTKHPISHFPSYVLEASLSLSLSQTTFSPSLKFHGRSSKVLTNHSSRPPPKWPPPLIYISFSPLLSPSRPKPRSDLHGQSHSSTSPLPYSPQSHTNPLFLWIEHITTLSTRFFHTSYHHDEGGLSLTDCHTLNLLNLKQNPGLNLPKWFGTSENTGTTIPTSSSIPNSSMFPNFVCTQTKKAKKNK